MTIHLVAISSEICEDSYEEGEGKCTGAGLDDQKVGKDFNSEKQMFEWLSDHYGLSPKKEDYECSASHGLVCQTDKMVADHSNEQNGGWFEPSKEEKKKWKKGRMKLYNEHYWIHFHEY